MTGTLSSRTSVLFVDADNTLWDTNGVYANAQLALLTAVENRVEQTVSAEDRLAWLRDLDQRIAERHHARLRYPARLLAKAVALRLAGHDAMSAVRLAWAGGREGSRISEDEAAQIEREFLEALAQQPRLRQGVGEGLHRLKQAGCMIVVLTEGGRQKVLSLLDRHGLGALVDRVIEAPKERKLFERLMKLTRRPTAAFMVGDQLDRDIQPAKAAGLTTIFFPGGFRPSWEPREIDARFDYKVEDFRQAAAIITTVLATGAAPAAQVSASDAAEPQEDGELQSHRRGTAVDEQDHGT